MTTDRTGGPTLSPEERQRYSRHLVLPQVGPDGQRTLKAARVLIVGAGGLGSPVAMYLAAAGIGTLGLVDFDVVDVTNLHRQLLHGTSDVGRTKLASARDRLYDINPNVIVELHDARLTSANALEMLRRYDLIVDGTDNFATRYLVNDACVLLGIPNVYGSIFRFEGQASVFSTPDGPCYRCLFPEPPPVDSVPNCAEGGVLGVLPGMVGTIQAAEAIKLVLGIGRTLAGRLLLIDALTMEYRSVQLRRDPECPACGTRTITTLIDYDEFCGSAPPVPSASDAVGEISPAELAALLVHGGVDLIDVREPHEWDAGHVTGARLVPLGQLGAAIATLDPEREVVVMCRSGGRGANAAAQLRAAGFTRVRNLSGGLTRWQSDDEMQGNVG
jgi:molybdopterin/thiamine biosynthesis adenylyltransferase/rhodanese-related sulfurtransferase